MEAEGFKYVWLHLWVAQDESHKEAFINDVMHIWPKIESNSPSATLKWLFYLQLYTPLNPSYQRDVIYEWSLSD